MYLEISGRRTGKTKRLVASVIRAHLEGYRPFVFTSGQHGIPYIRRLIVDHMGAPDIPTLGEHVAKHTTITHTKDYWDFMKKHVVDLFDPGVRVFYDEFDLQDIDGVAVSPTGYYSSSPMRTRTDAEIKAFHEGSRPDLLLRLLKANQWQYTSHSALQHAMTLNAPLSSEVSGGVGM